MQPATGWRPQPTIGAGKEEAASARPTFLPLDLHVEWDLVVQARDNLLLVGSSSATDAMLAALTPHLREPFRHYEPASDMPVPQPHEGTLILSEVARLSVKQQTQLLRWLDQLDDPAEVQVVSTTSEALFSLVESGAFLANLYYRLNVVRMDLSCVGDRFP